jgi:type IV pilus biogenesis protein CpaD/CtpE
MTSNAVRVRRRLADFGVSHGKLLRSAVAISQTHTAAPARRHRTGASGIGEV